jgi:hypothetical protein
MKLFTNRAVLLILACASASIASAQGGDGSRAARPPHSVTWTTVTVDKLGIRGLELPPGMKPGEFSDTAAKSSDDIPTDSFTRTWVMNRDKLHKEVSISVTNWHADFAKVTGKPAELATPENLILMTHSMGRRAIKEKHTHTIDSQLLEVGGVPGSYDVVNSPTDGLTVVWGTHRYLGGKAQQIMITVSRFARADALRIIKSVVFLPSDKAK